MKIKKKKYQQLVDENTKLRNNIYTLVMLKDTLEADMIYAAWKQHFDWCSLMFIGTQNKDAVDATPNRINTYIKLSNGTI